MLTGDAPFFNDWETSAVDQRQEKIYMYGGIRPYDDKNMPSSDFHCLDLKTNQWLDLTDSLKFRPRNYVYNPFAKKAEHDILQCRQLPSLTETASALVSVGGGTYFLLFGGHNTKNTTSDLIAVDLDLLVWWVVKVQGTPLLPRMSASMVAVDNRLFVFGGRETFIDETPGIPTYSVAEYNPHTQWTWTISDAPLPPDLRLLGYGIQSTPVFKGQKILLTQGSTDEKPIDMSRASTIFFHTENHTFQDARTTMGHFPQAMSWYRLASLVPPSKHAAPKRPRGRPRNNPDPLPQIPAAVHALWAHDFPDSVVIVAWVQHTVGSEDLVPEAWQYILPPGERIRCLNLREKLWDLNLDLQTFVAVGSRLLLLGSREGRGPPDAEDTERVGDKPLPRWDVVVEISSEYLKA
ncbi:hypothetical protein DFH08DRAFT_705312 [Mycena albidolilacea]|uniref:Galactose oxidase n=1 Tax=Mycena albidolilacea TaxID=1033008 RepID=A0AAD7EN29_9AGAR|nr:hypothetical protein DFH08DRAFT_705312 [Mycena albidolilacea]